MKILLAWLFIGSLSPGTTANGASAIEQSCDGLVTLSLELFGADLLPCGVVVGEFVVENSSDKSCLFEGGISIESGNFLFELEQPDGSIIELDHSGHPKGGVQWAELEPGDVFFHPVCLMKLNGKYLFKESGKYRLRGVYHSKCHTKNKKWRMRRNRQASSDLNTFPQPVPIKSNWVEIIVKQPQGRILQFKNSHPWGNVYMSFSVFDKVEQMEMIWKQLGGYYEYNHEQEKFIIYQRASRAIGGILLGMDDKNEYVSEAKEVLALAQKCKIGEKMWEWIIARLEESNEEAKRRNSRNARNGYIFH